MSLSIEVLDLTGADELNGGPDIAHVLAANTQPVESVLSPEMAIILSKACIISPADTRRFQCGIFKRAGVGADGIEDFIRVYNAVVADLYENCRIIATLDVSVRRHFPNVDFVGAERAIEQLKHQQTGFATPDPILLREAARRLVGVEPSPILVRPGEHPVETKLRYSVERVAHILRESPPSN